MTLTSTLPEEVRAALGEQAPADAAPRCDDEPEDTTLRRCRFCGQRGKELCIYTLRDLDAHEAACSYNPDAVKADPAMQAYWRERHGAPAAVSAAPTTTNARPRAGAQQSLFQEG